VLRVLVLGACLAMLLLASAAARPAWLRSAEILVPGDPSNQDCRTAVCAHNENTDLIRWRSAIWLVHRTAGSHLLGPASALDGPVAFRWNRRLFVIARKHLRGAGIRKRTALYEITGDLEGGPTGIVEHGELPSAGDTSYAGVARIRGSRFGTTWYSSPPAEDPSWLAGFGGRTDIWKAELDLSRLRR
jgi:hypothetical protein